jgi:hypothetical protein
VVGFDTDGDSLKYQFTDYLLDTIICPAQPFVNQIPFNSYEPLDSQTPYFIDSIMGWYSFHPSTLQIGHISIKILETRNGIVINETTLSTFQGVISTCIATSIENEFDQNMKIYPAITTGILNFEIPSIPYNVEIQISDITGRLVFSQSKEVSKSFNINIEEFKPGLYILKVLSKSTNSSNSGGNVKIIRIIKV